MYREKLIEHLIKLVKTAIFLLTKRFARHCNAVRVHPQHRLPLLSLRIAAANATIILGSYGADILMQINGANVQGSINISAAPVLLADLPMALPHQPVEIQAKSLHYFQTL